MGKITDALKKAAQEKLARIEKLDQKSEVKYEFIAKKTTDSNIDARIIAFYEPKSPISEQYRSLRTNIQAINSKTPIKTLTITSSSHSEGKTITAINLAVTMAHDLNKKRILLIDADLRRASMTKYLGISAHPGLSDLVADGINFEDALLNIGIENLTIMPAGKIPHNPAEILGSPKMSGLITQLRNKYDYIIFDSPPIIPVTDAGVIGSQTDGVIMVVKANKTQKGVVKHSESLLKQSHSKILGYILTNVQYHIPAYIYRYL